MPGNMRRECVCSTFSTTFALIVLLITPGPSQSGANGPTETATPNSREKPPLGGSTLDFHEKGEFLRQLFAKYGNGSGRLSFRGFSKLMGSIGLGDDGSGLGMAHDHREMGGAGEEVPGHDTSIHRHVEHQEPSPQESQTHGYEEAESTSHEPFTMEDQQHAREELLGSGAGVTLATGDEHKDGVDDGKHTTDWDEREHTHLTQCLSPDTMLDIFEISQPGLTEKQFLQICPVLLQQLDSHVCMQFDVNGDDDHDGHGDHDGHDDHDDHNDHDDHDDHGTSTHSLDEDTTHGHHDINVTGVGSGHLTGHIWGYGIAAITLISFASIACILVVPCMQHYPHVYRRLLSFLVAMAVGTLAGDAMMHLIPHSLGIHVHDDTKPPKEDDGHAHEALEAEKQHAINAVWKGFFVLIGIFLFFIIEQLMEFCQQARKDRKARKKTRQRADKKSSSQRPLHSGHQHEDSDDQQHHELQGEYTKINSKEAIGEKLCHHCTSVTKAVVGPNREIIRNSMLLLEDLELNNRVDQASTSNHHHHCHRQHDDDPENGPSHHHGHSHEPPAAGGNSIATLAWIIVMGDGLHNFCDGLIVGAAFADSIAGGLSTSIAVMCHEIPHELGDFAVMLKGGMTIKQALCVQALSSVLAYMGLAIGIAAGNIESVSMWIFALAGGMFVYIALVDLFPELIETLNTGKKLQLLLLQSSGTVVGVSIMLLIGLHEDWLREQLNG